MPGMRIFSYSVAGVLGLLMMSSTMTPIIADSSERALLDAPIRLVTSPIKGVVEDLTLKPGDGIRSGDVLGSVRNNDVDKSKLIELELKVSDLTYSIATQTLAIAEGRANQGKLEAAISQQRRALIEQFLSQVDTARATLAKFEAHQAIAQTSGDREKKLKARGVVGGDLANFENTIEAASSEKEGARIELQAAENRLAAAESKIYLGPDAGPINSLLEELRASLLKTNAAVADVSGLSAMLLDVRRIRDEELKRVARLSRHSIVAGGSGAIFEVGRLNGSAVSDGDAIAQSIDCADAFVVAIFSERKARALSPGAGVTVRSDGWDKPIGGAIEKLVPRTTSMSDSGFAVPFPPTERRELYAIVNIDELDAEPGKGTCQIGKWVAVSLDDGAIPSAADLTRSAQQAVSSAFNYVYAQTAEMFSSGKVHASEPASLARTKSGMYAITRPSRTRSDRLDRLRPPIERLDR